MACKASKSALGRRVGQDAARRDAEAIGGVLPVSSICGNADAEARLVRLSRPRQEDAPGFIDGAIATSAFAEKWVPLGKSQCLCSTIRLCRTFPRSFRSGSCKTSLSSLLARSSAPLPPSATAVLCWSRSTVTRSIICGRRPTGCGSSRPLTPRRWPPQRPLPHAYRRVRHAGNHSRGRKVHLRRFTWRTTRAWSREQATSISWRLSERSQEVGFNGYMAYECGITGETPEEKPQNLTKSLDYVRDCISKAKA